MKSGHTGYTMKLSCWVATDWGKRQKTALTERERASLTPPTITAKFTPQSTERSVAGTRVGTELYQSGIWVKLICTTLYGLTASNAPKVRAEIHFCLRH